MSKPIEQPDGTWRYERNGEVWETGEYLHVRFAGEPCTRLDMRGNPETFFSEDSEIIEVADIGDDWTRYWYASRDAKLQGYCRELVEAYERWADKKGITIEEAQRRTNGGLR